MGIDAFVIIFLLSIPIFFFWKWMLFRKSKKDKTIAYLIAIIATIVSTISVYAISIVSIILVSSYYPNKNFNKSDWKKDIEERYELSEDLIESNILIGKSKQEVISILGKPDCDTNSDNWSYYLGFKPGGSIDPDVLDVEFRNDKVIKVGQHTS